MSKQGKLTGWLAVAALLIAGVPTALQTQDPPLCCIAGKYAGTRIPNPMRGCPAPKAVKFVMILEQQVRCGEAVWGTVTGPTGDVNHFNGLLSRGCVFTAIFGTPGHMIRFTGAFHKLMGKWHASGRYTEENLNRCYRAGTWEMKQI
jgi:hypothetical protein